MSNITNHELVVAYLNYIGKRLEGKGETLEPLLPFMMMDTQYQLFCSDIKPLALSHKLKQLRSQWRDCYNEWDREFFRAFNDAQRDDIVDKMEDYEGYIAPEVEAARMTVIPYLGNESPEALRVLSTCMLCNALARAAQVIWEKVYYKEYKAPAGHVRLGPESNPYLEKIAIYSRRFMNMYRTSKESVECRGAEEVDKSMELLCNKMVSWLYK